MYSIGRKHAGKSVLVRFDAHQKQWGFLLKPEEDEKEPTEELEAEELARRTPKNLDIQTLTGLDPEDFQSAPSVQLTLPCLL